MAIFCLVGKTGSFHKMMIIYYDNNDYLLKQNGVVNPDMLISGDI